MRYQPREDGPSRVFHLTARVNWRVWYLQSDEAKAALCRVLRESAEAFGVRILAVVLMANHIHLVVQSPPPELFRRLTGRRTACRHFRRWPTGHPNASVIAQFMRRVGKVTSDTRHRELGLSGHFWEARYDARPVLGSLSLTVRIAYDHRNPIKAGIVERAEDYVWSTAAEWACGKPGPVPLSAWGPLPFGLTWDELRAAVLKYQGSRRLDEVREELDRLFSAREDVEPDVLEQLLG